MSILLGIVVLVVIVGIALLLFINQQGKENVVFAIDKRTQAKLVKETPGKITFEVEVPVENVGQDEGIIMDAYMRPYLCQEQYEGALLRGKVNLKDKPRADDYFEAMIAKPHEPYIFVLKFELTPIKAANAREALLGMPDIDVALFADQRGRSELYTTKKIITLTSEELKNMLA